MNELALKILVTISIKHCANAAEAISDGKMDDAQKNMDLVNKAYQQYVGESADEAPDTVLEQMRVEGEKRYLDTEETSEQQEDDAQDHKSTDDKGCVGDRPHEVWSTEP